ncbi:hypothetical protein [Methylobacterium segetis]|uniref:hypothetical protein n=1 Tax=Methylobacterium segetis TaxID=2488750 RepID=UPI001052E99A|nr:hypothetical protein [Methylobacterium segetis]
MIASRDLDRSVVGPERPAAHPLEAHRGPAARADARAGETRRAHEGAGFGHLPFCVVVLLVAAPNLLFLATHLASSVLAAGCLAAILAALVPVLRDCARTREPLDAPLLLIALAAGYALCLLGGETHLVFANDDWLIRDAVLHDLVAEPWPVGYLYRGDPTLLRAPLGLFLVPAAVGKLAGLQAAHGALLAQNGLLFGCLFYGFARIVRPRRRGLTLLALFIGFSGWDVVGTWLTEQPLGFGTHLEQWAKNLQFSSHVTQIFWVPNHAASGWIFVGAYCLWRADALRVPSLAVIFGLCVFWSPLSMIGAVPFLIGALLRDLPRGRVTVRSSAIAALAGLGLIPVALYLGSDAARVPHGLHELSDLFVIRYVLFVALELGPALIVLGLARDRIATTSRGFRSEILLIVGLLLLVPLYRLGGTDFVMRASIPALALLALRVGAAVSGTSIARAAIACTLLGVGAVTPLYELGRALREPAFAISGCDLLAAARTPPNDGPLFHYLARLDVVQASLAGRVLAMPATMLRPEPRGPCWPDRVREGAAPLP